MNVHRAAFVVLACAAALVHAQEKPGDYPRKPIRIVQLTMQPYALIVHTSVPVKSVKALALDGNEVVAPVTPEELKAKLDREYAELERLIKALNITIN